MKLTCYPTYGYKDQDGAWRISVRVWVYENRPHEPLIELLERAVELKAHFDHHRIDLDRARSIFTERIDGFCREGVPNREVEVEFWDATSTNSSIAPKTLTTDEHGVVCEELKLGLAEAPWLDGKGDRWLTYRASIVNARDIAGPGQVQLLDAHGVSVISDIDDTIKITEIPAGKEVVALNTFLRAFVSVDHPNDMVRIYNASDPIPGGRTLSPSASFHYVSGGPWQLYEPLWEYLIRQKHFPSGSFHLRTVGLEHAAHEEWQHLVDLAERAFNLSQESAQVEENLTYKHKKQVIEGLMNALPGRKFLMFGDSGEFDPEVYESILMQQRFKQMVMETCIRDVKDLARADPTRLQTMKKFGIIVCPALPILKGKSQFD